MFYIISTHRYQLKVMQSLTRFVMQCMPIGTKPSMRNIACVHLIAAEIIINDVCSKTYGSDLYSVYPRAGTQSQKHAYSDE